MTDLIMVEPIIDVIEDGDSVYIHHKGNFPIPFVCPKCKYLRLLMVDFGDYIESNGKRYLRVESDMNIISDGHSQDTWYVCPACNKRTRVLGEEKVDDARA